MLTASGWLKFAPTNQTEASADGPAGKGGSAHLATTNLVPVLQPGQTLHVVQGTLLEHVTRAPARYTPASLLQALETIGQPVTSAILDGLITLDCVRLSQGRLEASHLGKALVDALVGRFSFLAPGFAGELEQSLNDIAEGRTGYRDFLRVQSSRLQAELQDKTKAKPKGTATSKNRLRDGAAVDLAGMRSAGLLAPAMPSAGRKRVALR